MISVFKYPLDSRDGRQRIRMPEGARILCAKEQRGGICFWAVVDTAKPVVTRVFHIIGTGWEIKFEIERTNYLGTVLLDGGDLVFHVFEEVA